MQYEAEEARAWAVVGATRQKTPAGIPTRCCAR